MQANAPIGDLITEAAQFDPLPDGVENWHDQQTYKHTDKIGREIGPLRRTALPDKLLVLVHRHLIHLAKVSMDNSSACEKRTAVLVSLLRQEFAAHTTFTRSPFGSGSRWMSMVKSIALMMPSPNSSWINALSVVP